MKQSELNKMLEGISTRKARFSVGENRGPETMTELHKGSVTGEDRYARAIKKIQVDSDKLLLTSKSTGIPVEKLNAYAGFKRFIEDDSELKKVMTDTTQSNWIPSNFSADFVDAVGLELKVAALFPEVQMTSPTQYFSIKTDFSTAYTKTEGSDATASPNITDQKGTLTAKVIAVYQTISDELDQDAAFAQAPMLRNDCITAIGRGIENAIINGDSSTTHLDTDVTLAYDVRHAWQGLRRYAYANSLTTDLSTFNADTVTALLGSMGVYGADPSQIAVIVGTGGRIKLLNLKDNQNNRVYLEYGTPGAMNVAMVPGGVGKLAGCDVLVSEFCRENLNASGFYDSTVATKKSLLFVRKDGWVRGMSRNMTVETDRDIVAQYTKLVVSTRMAFAPRYYTGETTTWLGYNI
ncbi:MAG: phage major capsid protein [Patescibacteria group bacterium]|jgi:HK97 family phage major capsid protein